MLQAFVHVKELMQFLAPSRHSVLEEQGCLEALLVPALSSAWSTLPPKSTGFTPSLHIDVPSSEGPSWQHCMTNLSGTPLYFLFPYVVFFLFIAFIIAWHIYGFVCLFFPINIGTLLYPIYPQHREPYLINNCLMNEQNRCNWKSSSQLSLTSSVALVQSLRLSAALIIWKGWTRSSPYEGSSPLLCFLPFEFCWSVWLMHTVLLC